MKTVQKSVVVIVGAYSTGKFLAAMFAGNGYRCIHIEPCPDLHPDYKIGTEAFTKLFFKTIQFNDNLQNVITELMNYDIKCIVPGSEAGVLLADMLNSALGMTNANTMTHSLARRDKYLMQEMLNKRGVASIPHLLSDDLSNILTWINSSVGYPVVIKPVSSSDSEGVYFCHSDEEVKTGFNKILGKLNVYGETNLKILAQKKLQGVEYVVNSVSYNGTHFVTDIWSNIKKPVADNFAYDYQDLISKSDPVFSVLACYIKSVLDALDIKHGAGHSEVMLTDTGPVLIEIGARLSGSFNPSATMDALGYSQASLLVDTYLNPDRFLNLVASNSEGVLKKNIKIVSMIVNQTIEKVTRELDAKDFMQLKEFYSMQYIIELGQKLRQTNDLTTSPGNIYLIADSADVLQQAYTKVRQLEQSAYLKLAQEPLISVPSSIV